MTIVALPLRHLLSLHRRLAAFHESIKFADCVPRDLLSRAIVARNFGYPDLVVGNHTCADLPLNQDEALSSATGALFAGQAGLYGYPNWAVQNHRTRRATLVVRL